MGHPDVTLDFTSGSSADTTSFSASNPAKWIACYGAGTITLLNNASTPASVTYTVGAGDVIPGEWTAFTSTTCSRIRMTTANGAPSFGSAFSTTVPGTSIQSLANGGATQTSAFTAAVGTFYAINPQATFAYTFPAISSANDGMKIAIYNINTGSTATVATPNGSDNIGNCAGSVTGATAAGPTGGATKVYTADNTRKTWIVGI